MKRDELIDYYDWIHYTVNPQRRSEGVPPLTDDEARFAYNLIKDFSDNWNKPTMLAEREGGSND